jgi:hypothetical protein
MPRTVCAFAVATLICAATVETSHTTPVAPLTGIQAGSGNITVAYSHRYRRSRPYIVIPLTRPYGYSPYWWPQGQYHWSLGRSSAKLLSQDEVRGSCRISDRDEYQVATVTNAPLMRLANTSIANRTNPCSRSVARDSPEHSRASYSNMSNTAHSEVERSSPSSHGSRTGSGFSRPVDTLPRPDRFGLSQTCLRPAIRPPPGRSALILS